MAKNKTAQEIVAEAKTARRELGEMEYLLQEEIDKLDFAVFKRSTAITDQERKTRTELRASQTEIREAYVALAYFSLRRLDQSDEVHRLQQRMKEINQGLTDDLDRLKDIEGFAETAAKIADAVAKATAKLAQLAARVSAGGV